MSPLDPVAWVCWGGGVVTGVTALGVVWLLKSKPGKTTQCPDPDAHLLDDADRVAVESEFAAHAEAAKQGLHDYADLLAGGDLVLRDRLRMLADGVR